MVKLTLGSLFAGIGGIDLGFERAGFKTVWQVEKNAYCRSVLRRHFPDADRRVTDVRFAGKRNLARVDAVAAGFPCQDISNAGKRAGITGRRSGLFYDAMRIISELRPRVVLLENVTALLIRGMGEVLGALSEIGYDAEWEVISAKDVRADHKRERIWIVANAEGKSILELSKTHFNTYPASGGLSRQGEHQSPIDQAANPFREASGFIDAIREGTLPHVCRRHHGFSKGLDEPAMRALGNAVVPQIPELIANRIAEVLA